MDSHAGIAVPASVPAPSFPAGRTVGARMAHPTPATRALYAGDWARFVARCRGVGYASLPASSATVAAYLLAIAPDLSRGALGRRRAAMHRQANLPVPQLDPEAQKALRAIARPKAPTRSGPPLTQAGLRRMASQCPSDLPSLRDRELLLMVAALTRATRPQARQQPLDAGEPVAEAVPRLFLLALDAEHVRCTASGIALHVRARIDEQNPSRTVTLTRSVAADTCPARALENWLRASETEFGPVFRTVDRWSNVEHGRLGPDARHRIIARRVASLPRRHTGDKRDG